MGTGAITQHIDVAQLVLYGFWLFFACLIYYLVREGHREGYPMDTATGRGKISGWPMPAPKTYKLAHGGEFTAPNDKVSPQVLAAEPAYRWAGAPLVPTGDPMHAGVGPGAWADRADEPDLDYTGQPKLMPLRRAIGYGVVKGYTDPRGLPMVGDDDAVGGTVVDLWVDNAETLFRYLEVELTGSARRVLVPWNFARIKRDKVKVGAVLGKHFAGVPATRQADVVTMLEEEKIMAYFGAGTLYAVASRGEPLL